jgi:hypothetical protein
MKNEKLKFYKKKKHKISKQIKHENQKKITLGLKLQLDDG